MKRHVLMAAIALVVGWWGLASTVSAQQGPCADDVKKFCKDVKPGGGRIIRCLEEHQSELSDGCKKHAETQKAQMQSHGGPCKADVEKFCKDVKRGGGRIAKCLEGHESELSAECKAQRAKHMPKKPAGSSAQPAATPPAGATPR